MSKSYSKGSDEITLRELIFALADYFRFFLKKWYFFLIGGLLAGGLAFYLVSIEEVTYSAPLTFTLEGASTSGSSGSILGQLGLGTKEGTNVEKLLELSRSRRILTPVLFDSVSVEGKEDLLANHLIRYYNYHERWAESPLLKDFLFKDGKPSKDDTKGNQAFKQLYRLISGPPLEDALTVLSVNELTGIFTLDSRANQPEISDFLTSRLYSSLEEFHINATVSKQVATVRRLEVKADSIIRLLEVSESQLARERDRNSGVTLYRNNIKEQRLNRDVLILSTMYSEVLRNKETASFLLATDRPAFVVIDEPLFPLRAIKPSLLKSLLIGVVISVIIVGVVLFFWKLIRDAIEQSPNVNENE